MYTLNVNAMSNLKPVFYISIQQSHFSATYSFVVWCYCMLFLSFAALLSNLAFDISRVAKEKWKRKVNIKVCYSLSWLNCKRLNVMRRMTCSRKWMEIETSFSFNFILFALFQSLLVKKEYIDICFASPFPKPNQAWLWAHIGHEVFWTPCSHRNTKIPSVLSHSQVRG